MEGFLLALAPTLYPTIMINTFMTTCGLGVQGELMLRGWPKNLATYKATEQCSCVMDKIRSRWVVQDFVALTEVEKRKYSTKFSLECAGLAETATDQGVESDITL
jgi:hypothetical protein